MPQVQTAESVLAAHRDRLRPVDRMIPEADALPEPGEGDELLEVDGAQGLLTHTRVDADALEAVLGPLDRWELTPGSPGPTRWPLCSRAGSSTCGATRNAPVRTPWPPSSGPAATWP